MKLKIDTAQVEKISQKMRALIQEYQGQYAKVYENANQMGQYWDGEAKKTYLQKVEGFRNDFEKMVKVLTNYSEKLTLIAKRYNEAETNAKNLASRMSIGK
ncbi:MAG TPA: WXG100 family type VII secretion target [Clostridia bacterium]|nr:WXG100 family type VII secretion target [Clostridia bacterium]